MGPAQRQRLLERLKASQTQAANLLRSMAGYQDWPGEPGCRSFRDMAAWLAALDEECFLPCFKQIARGDNPYIEPYHWQNDAGPVPLPIWLDRWTAARRKLLNFMAALPGESWQLSGRHAVFGPVTLLGLLLVLMDHDREHLQQIEQMISNWSRAQARPSEAPLPANGTGGRTVGC